MPLSPNENWMVDAKYPEYGVPRKYYCDRCGYEREKEEVEICDKCIERNLPKDNGIWAIKKVMEYFTK